VWEWRIASNGSRRRDPPGRKSESPSSRAHYFPAEFHKEETMFVTLRVAHPEHSINKSPDFGGMFRQVDKKNPQVLSHVSRFTKFGFVV
jgi:hypothetical protein